MAWTTRTWQSRGSHRKIVAIVTSAAQKILAAALELPSEEREDLVGALSVSLEPGTMSQEWQVEIARRLQRIEDGSATFHDAEDHLETLRAKYGR